LPIYAVGGTWVSEFGAKLTLSDFSEPGFEVRSEYTVYWRDDVTFGIDLMVDRVYRDSRGGVQKDAIGGRWLSSDVHGLSHEQWATCDSTLRAELDRRDL
jgi:hypothetical protein